MSFYRIDRHFTADSASRKIIRVGGNYGRNSRALATLGSWADLAIYSPPIGPQAFPYRRVLGMWQLMY